MKLHCIIAGALAITMALPSVAAPKKKQQEPEKVNPYQFTEQFRIPVTSVKDQNATGTCWCFATTSFIEAELLRMGKGEYDLSELYTVRQNYIVPQSAYSGINYDSPLPNHRELRTYLKAIADASVSLKARSDEYWELQDALFDIYMGEVPETFTYEGKEYTPESFRDMLGLNTDDYIEITSFSHHPFYQQVPLEVPDNWDHALLYNLPLDEMMAVIDNALNTGYTVSWDGDVSEKGYVYSPLGIAILPADASLDRKAIGATDTLIAEVEEVDQELRQQGYESFTTTDDHLEHLIGIANDPAGTKYYITKNSWGAEGPYEGYHYMSEKYVRAKTISIIVHKDAIPSDIKAKLGL